MPGCNCPEDGSWICINCIAASEPQMSQPPQRNYNSFSGVDISAVFNNETVRELQQIEYRIERVESRLLDIRTWQPGWPDPNPKVRELMDKMEIEYVGMQYMRQHDGKLLLRR